VPLFEGRQHDIDADVQTKIATWVTMATMTGEYMSQDPRRIAIPQAHRDWFMANASPPQGWGVWIGRYRWGLGTPGVPQSAHLSLHVLDSETLPTEPLPTMPPPNTQTTSFCLGEFFAFVMSSVFPEIARGWDWRTAPSANFKLQRIWPIEQPVVHWPPPTMTDLEAAAYPVAFAHYMDDLALRVGYQHVAESGKPARPDVDAAFDPTK
jgi:hypothetical protein